MTGIARNILIWAALIGVCLPAHGALADDFKLALPVACELGEECWIINHVDQDPGDKYQDFRCGHLSYNTHKGTDFGLKNLALMEAGVPVLASASGVVAGTRDGMDDINLRDLPEGAVKGKECGNGIRVHHSDGWATQYCHLKKGSVRVKKGDKVTVGQQLGEIGLSGATEFPHVHLQVSKDKKIIDPFVGLSEPAAACEGSDKPLWSRAAAIQVTYTPPYLLDVGFANRVISSREAASGQFSGSASFSNEAAAITIWLRAAGIKVGDKMRLQIFAPDGQAMTDKSLIADKNKIMRFSLSGRKKPKQGWPKGIYRGVITLSRDNGPTRTKQINLKVE